MGDEVRLGVLAGTASADDFSGCGNVDAKLLLLGLPAAVVFGILFWVMIFLQTYRHFPKMEPQKRFAYSATAATVMTAILLLVATAGFYFFVWAFNQ